MSTALSKAVYARLSGSEALTGAGGEAQAELATLLGLDTESDAPAVFFGNKSSAQAFDGSGNPLPLYPCITFRPSGGSTDRRFQQETGAVERVLYDFEIWEDGTSAKRITDIAECMELLLDTRRGVVSGLSLESGKLFAMQAFSPLAVVYDPSLHAWAGLVRYEFLEVRY
jgi:hypothetical protein